MRLKKAEFTRAMKKIPKHDFEAAVAELLRSIPGSGHNLPPVAMARVRTKLPKMLEKIVRERALELITEFLPAKSDPRRDSHYNIDEDLTGTWIAPLMTESDIEEEEKGQPVLVDESDAVSLTSDFPLGYPPRLTQQSSAGTFYLLKKKLI